MEEGRQRTAPPPLAPRQNMHGRKPQPISASWQQQHPASRDYNDNCRLATAALDNRRTSRATEKIMDKENNPQGVQVDATVIKDVGISSLPGQLKRRALNKGFSLNLMVVGEAGLGKSTLINSMFLSSVYTSEGIRAEKTVRLVPHTVLLEEKGVRLSLTVIDTPGFGDIVDNTNCWQPIVNHLEEQFSHFLEGEIRVERGQGRRDSRVHALLYFLPPTGHGVRRIDVETMKRLQDKVNIIPVIGKADAFTEEELKDFKQKILAQLSHERISVFDFPGSGRGPWAVVGSNTVLQMGEETVWGRRYPWGTVSIEDPRHCDFSLLRSLLLARHTMNLVESTDTVHYETFRCKELSSLAAINENKATIPNKNPLAVIEDETAVHVLKVSKMEQEMEEVFKKKVEEKNARLRRCEREWEEETGKARRRLEEEREEMERRREQHLREMQQFEGVLDGGRTRTGPKSPPSPTLSVTKTQGGGIFKTIFSG